MKPTLALTLLAAISIFNPVYSEQQRWFYQPIDCYIFNESATCHVTNYRFTPIFCEANILVRTYLGQQIRNFNKGWIQTRQTSYVNIYIPNPHFDSITFINAQARCLY